MVFVSLGPTCELKRAVEGFTAKCVCLLSACILSLHRDKYNLISFTDELYSGQTLERERERKGLVRVVGVSFFC